MGEEVYDILDDKFKKMGSLGKELKQKTGKEAWNIESVKEENNYYDELQSNHKDEIKLLQNY